ncbi:MAG: agmatine deiminase family protein [Acidimicrobiia bacterium]
MPAETAPHERTLIAFPCRESLWRGHLGEGRRAFAGVARAIARFEPVTVLARPDDTDEARALCGETVEVVEFALDDSWVRDTGPVYVTNGAVRRGVDFAFNGWGGKYVPYDTDATIARRWCELAGDARREVPMVLEGGAIAVDGQGTMVTTEQCLLHPNRNPSMTRSEIEAVLADALGVTAIVWIPYGIDDRDTDGHVDNSIAFPEPGMVLLQSCADRHDPEHDRARANRQALDASVDAAGQRLTVVELPELAYVEIDGERLPVPYANLYAVNGAVIVPVTGHPADDGTLEIVAGCYPDREVVPVPGAWVAYGGGGPHCMTQQVPIPCA